MTVAHEPKVMDDAVDQLNETLAFVETVVHSGVTKLREAIIAERVAPHPAQQQLADLEAMTRQVIGRLHWMATRCHNAGAHQLGSDLRKIAQETSRKKAEVLGEVKPLSHDLHYSVECGIHNVSCVCGFAVGGLPVLEAAERYGNAHLESITAESSGAEAVTS